MSHSPQMIRWFDTVILLLIVQLCFAQSQYRFQQFDKQQGLLTEFGHAVIQDSLGFLWIHPLEPRHLAVTSLDEQFITKVMNLIEAHMDDEHFSIEDFSSEAGYCRMQFYRKIKALTDQTPSQFARSIRLKRAAQLLRAKIDNVTQIAYTVGFSSLAYFNKCFKEQYGVTPGQYADANEPDMKL